MASQESRSVSLPLGIGIFFLPYVFAWLLLRQGYSARAKRIAFGWMVILGSFVLLRPSTSVSPTPSPTPVAAAGASAPDVRPVMREVDPAEERQKNKAVLSVAQQRLELHRQKLQGYYANNDAIERSSNDLAKLTAIAVSRGMSKAKEDQQQAAQAKALAVQVAEQIRVMYASLTEEGFIKKGIDSRVSAVGKGKDRLVVSYALMSQPMVYKFQNEAQLPVQARALGFKQIQYTNGFESELGKTWIVELTDSKGRSGSGDW